MSDDFATPSDSGKSFPERKKTVFMKTVDGHSYTVRILEPKSTQVFTHYLQQRYNIKCLGEDCPLCTRNSEIYAADPDNYRKDPNYSPRHKRYFVNILDKTVVKKCPKCNLEYANLNKGLCDCGENLLDAAPSNTVKVFSKGPTVFEDQLNVYHNSILDQAGEKIGVNNFDIMIVVTGRGKDTTTTIVPMAANRDPVPEGLELFDLDSITIELEPEEMLDVQRGVSLKDIFAARRAEEDSEFPPQETISDEVQRDVEAAVEKLFSQ